MDNTHYLTNLKKTIRDVYSKNLEFRKKSGNCVQTDNYSGIMLGNIKSPFEEELIQILNGENWDSLYNFARFRALIL